MKREFRRLLGIAAATAAALASGIAVAQKTELLVYTALETDQLKAYTESFQKTNPNIDLKFVRDSTGVITAKLLAEKANPQADVVFGVAASSMEIFKQEGMLAPYAPRASTRSTASSAIRANPPSWVGMDVFARGGLLQHGRGAKKNVPKPESWADLAKPVYKGQVTMPNPASSGTGYFDVTAWLQTWAKPTAGSTWTRCTRTSRSTRTPARSPAASPARASSWSASPSTSAATT
jgi:iron(III) transport system substrate-binding protein